MVEAGRPAGNGDRQLRRPGVAGIDRRASRPGGRCAGGGGLLSRPGAGCVIEAHAQEPADPARLERSEERPVGKEGVSPCRFRWAPEQLKKTKINIAQ